MLGSGSYKSSLSIRLVALGKHLADKGWNVSMIMPSADKYNDFTPDHDAQIPNVKLIQPWQPATHSAMLNLFPYLFTSLIAILRARPDMVYLYKPTPITILGLIPKLLFRKPVILDLDDLGSEVMKLQQQSKLQYTLVATCERLAMRFASSIVVTSTYLEKIVREQYPNKQILVLPNGVEPYDYQPVEPKQPRHAIYYFGFVNRLSLVETMLRAVPAVVEKVPDAQVTIVGGGSALDEAKKLVRDLGVKKAVTFTGWVDVLEAQNYAQFADLAICCQPDIPTVRAASNMKVFQYMAMSTIPVVSDVGDLGSYVKNGKLGAIVPADDEAALAKALISLLLDDDKRTRTAKAARKAAESEYAWSVRVDELQGFLKSQLKDGAV